MSMLTLNGSVANIYESPRNVNKSTGEEYGGQHRIQLMCENTLKNGQKRIELIDLTVDDVTPYKDSLGAKIRVPVGVYVLSGKPAFYALKGQVCEKSS
jgi:hypothetical protein